MLLQAGVPIGQETPQVASLGAPVTAAAAVQPHGVEIDEQDTLAPLLDEHIGRLEIAVTDPAAGQAGERLQQGPVEPGGYLLRWPRTQPVL